MPGRMVGSCEAVRSEAARVPDRTVPGEAGIWGDEIKMVAMCGKERTECEFRANFATAILAINEIRPLPAGRYAGRILIDGMPASSQ